MAWKGKTVAWLPTRTLHQIDNAICPRCVIGIDRNKHLRLMLSGGGWLWYPEGTLLANAFADAKDRGFTLLPEVQA